MKPSDGLNLNSFESKATSFFYKQHSLPMRLKIILRDKVRKNPDEMENVSTSLAKAQH